MIDITAIILTKNEEKNIVDCLKSMEGFAKRCVVVDCGSTDNTVALAKENGAEVYTHPFESYAPQFNWALDNTNIDTAWTLRLDADERFTPALCRELEALTAQHKDDDVNGFVLEAWLYFMGRCMKYGGSQKKKLMLFKTGTGRIEDRRMDEHTILLSGRAIEVKERFIHYDFKDLNTYISKLNWYATREMQDYFIQQEKLDSFDGSSRSITRTRKLKFGFYYRFPMFLRSWLLFLYNYIFKLNFLNGKEGYIYTWLYCRFYRNLVDMKIYEQMKYNRPFEETGDLK